MIVAKTGKNTNRFLFLLFFVLGLLLFAFSTNAQERNVDWMEGPALVSLEDIAEIMIGENYLFANGDDCRTLMQSIGNPPSNEEVGIIVPRAENANWFLVFEYSKVGYVKDDEKDEIDSAAILESIQEGTEQANEYRVENGISPLHVIGWQEEPHYDESTNNLVWTMIAEDGDTKEQILNHNIRLLGRNGYMSVVLVTDINALDTTIPEVDHLISNFDYKEGKRYAEFVQGDKIAKYGLTALVAGGAATVAAKAGIFKLLAKFGKFILLGIIGLIAVFKGKIKSLFGK